jgi:hypothetical protein
MNSILNRGLSENNELADEVYEIYYLSEELNNYASVLVDIPDFNVSGKRMLNFNSKPEESEEYFSKTSLRMQLKKGQGDDGREMVGYATDQLELAIGQYL